MAIVYKDGSEWRVRGSKHEGETLQQVAKDDPTYLRWMYKKASEDLSDEAFYALEDVMKKFRIELP